MQIAVVTTATATSRRGNFSTIQRWVRHNETHDLVCIPPDPDADLRPVPDLVHGYHAVHGGTAALRLARRYQRPLIVSLGGTDLWALMERDESADQIERVLRAAACVTGAFDSFGRICADLLGKSDFAYVTVPRSVAIPDSPPAVSLEGVLRVLLPAGLRPVKDLRVAIELAAGLVERGIPIQLTIQGAAEDPEYAKSVYACAADMEFVRFHTCPVEEMHLAYGESDVCWNTSLQEGGANSVLEGLAHGCALYIRNVVGNREYFDLPDSPAMLFEPGDLNGAEKFHRAILEETREERHVRVAQARAWLKKHYSAEREAAAINHAWEVAAGRLQ